MARRKIKLTKLHLIAGLIAFVCMVAAIGAAIVEAWAVVVAALCLLIGEVLAISLISINRLSARLNRVSVRVERQVNAVKSASRDHLKQLESSRPTVTETAKSLSSAVSNVFADAMPRMVDTIVWNHDVFAAHDSVGIAAPQTPQSGNSPAAVASVAPSPFGSEAELVRRTALNGTTEMRSFVLQNRAYSAIDIMAQAAHPSHPSYTTLLETLRYFATRPSDPMALDFVKECDPNALQDIGDVVASARYYETALEDAMVFFESVRISHGAKALSPRNRLVYLESVIDAGQCHGFDAWAKKLDVSEKNAGANLDLLRANALHPAFLKDSRFDKTSWLASVNASFLREGLEPLGIAEGPLPAFDRIVCESDEHVDGPLVTVVVPTYDADERFDTAMASITGQTWQNLQIVVVDDATPGGVPELVREWEQRDSRIVVVRRDKNCGTYANRNFVLHTIAEGEFFTVHDDDDWSHPQKIQRQVEHLLETGLKANMSRRTRATEDLIFRRMNNNAVYVQANYSSLLFSVADIRENIGQWDEVNRSADGEFIDRIAAWMQRSVPVVSGAPLSFQRIREGSLTSNEVLRGYVDNRRKWYELSYRQWLAKRSQSSEEHPFLLESGARHPYSVPIDLSVAPEDRNGLHRVDVVFMGDFRGKNKQNERVCEEGMALLAAGKKIALVQISSPIHSMHTGINWRILQLARRPKVIVGSILDNIQAEALVIFDPSAMQYLEIEPAIQVTGPLYLTLEEDAADGIGSTYDTGRALNACRKLCGRSPIVIQESESVMPHLTRHLAKMKPTARARVSAVSAQRDGSPNAQRDGRQ